MIDIYTDGSGHRGGPCAWAVVIVGPEDQIIDQIVDGQPNGTSNIAEIQGVIAGLGWAYSRAIDDEIRVFTDSAYVMNAFTDDWITGWIKNGWKNARGRPVANKELWLILLDLVNRVKPQWIKVKSHSGNIHNDMADELCGKERKAWLGQTKEIQNDIRYE